MNTEISKDVAPRSAMDAFKSQFESRKVDFASGLPPHIPFERFWRVVQTAVSENPDLLIADRLSLFTSCMKAATDGLLPDGREGALVVYNTKVQNEWIKKVSWQPMTAGIKKKVRNSGEIANLDIIAVKQRDVFKVGLGDNPYIEHEPYIGPDEPGPSYVYYSIATLKSGEKSRCVMTRREVEFIRDTFSKKDREGKPTPAWRNSFDEMAKKTVFKRHSKTLPMSTDLDDLLRRDEELYDMGGKSDKKRIGTAPKSLGERLDMIAGKTPIETHAEPDHHVNPETGEITEHAGDSRQEHSEREPSESAAGSSNPVENGASAASPSLLQDAPDPTAQNDAKPAAEAVEATPEPTQGKAPAKAESAPARTVADPPMIAAGKLEKKGEEHAAKGIVELRKWYVGLTPDHQALLTPAINTRLKAIADKADAEVSQ